MENMDYFDNKYTHNLELKSEHFDDGRFETFGDDLKTVLKVAKESPLKVWTAVDCDEGFYLIQGYHLVNRVYYEITNENAESENEEYLIDLYDGA